MGDCRQCHAQDAQAEPCQRKAKCLQRMETDEFGFTTFPKENKQ